MFWKKRGVVQETQNHMQQVLMHSFNQVRRDVHNVYEWLRFLHDQNQQQQKIIEDLRQDLVLMPKNKEEIRDLIDAHYSMEPLMDRIAEIEAKLTQMEVQEEPKSEAPDHSELITKTHEVMSKSHDALIEKLHEISAKMEAIARPVHQPVHQPVQQMQPVQLAQQPMSRPQPSALQQKIIRNVTRNSKEYIKNILMQTITKYERISGLQLREIIVQEQGLVSRSSFYRLLLELEAEGKLTVTPEGKEKIYMPAKSEIVTV